MPGEQLMLLEFNKLWLASHERNRAVILIVVQNEQFSPTTQDNY